MPATPQEISSGLLLVDKPEGNTSFSTLSPLKKALGHGKVGHAGTLDKFATGLLLVLVGPYTKLNSYLSDLDKAYEGTMRFGATSDTLDTEGEIIDHGAPPDIDTIRKTAARFIGTYDQIPPKYSAVHVSGSRAYQRARRGEDVEIPSRRVHIYSFEIIDWQAPELFFSISCSKGTYIRSLARDMGTECGSAAYLTELRRTRIGPFSVEEAFDPRTVFRERAENDSSQNGTTRNSHTPTDIREHSPFISDRRLLEAIPGIELARIRPEYREKVFHGKPIQPHWLEKLPLSGSPRLLDYSQGHNSQLLDHSQDHNSRQNDHSPGEEDPPRNLVGIIDEQDRLAALCEREGRHFSYRFVIPHRGGGQ